MKLKSKLTTIFIVLFFPAIVLAKPSMNDKFVLMWSLPRVISNMDLDFLTNKGVNLVQSWGFKRNWTDEEILAYLDSIQNHNIGVMMTIGEFFKQEGSGPDWDGAASFIKKWMNHPAVFAWHSFDEPANNSTPSSYQEEVYRFIKHIDSGHPVFISWNGVREKHYDCCFSENAFDILDLHAYVQDKPGLRQQKLIDMFVSHRQKPYPVIITLRSFNGAKKPDLPSNGLKAQYDFFYSRKTVTENIGFYGWKLGPNKGISQVPDLMRQFRDLSF